MTTVTLDWTVIITGATLLAGIVASHVRLQSHMASLCEDVKALKSRAGMNGGMVDPSSQLVTRNSCELLHRPMNETLERIEFKLDEHIKAIGHPVMVQRVSDLELHVAEHLHRIDKKLDEQSGNLREFAIKAGIKVKEGQQ